MLQITVDFLRKEISKNLGKFVPEIGIVLGSGLGELADEYCDYSISYSEIPGFEVSTISGHKGRLVFAKINGKNVVMMQGRFHYYEGYPIQKVVYPIKVMKGLGVKTLIPAFNPSDLMVITDHINLMGVNPLVGMNDDEMGERFPDMSEAYSPELVELARKTASKIGVDLQEGVYAALSGPSYETPAEVRMLRTLGADAVGMSTVPEAIIASWAKLKLIGISCICNSAAGIRNVTLSHEDVINAANTAKQRFKQLVTEIIKNL